ncbi:MAG: hypothetical protein M1400_02235 [Patescibacteria group bacterium]|nr:hypothetical protein [Patescibacteria group bacterium]
MKKKILLAAGIFCGVCVIVLAAALLSRGNTRIFFSARQVQLSDSDLGGEAQEALPESYEANPPAAPVVVTPLEVKGEPKDTSALGGYNVLIADRGNNRLLEVTPDKRVVWEYAFHLPKAGLGADDSFFTDSGNSVIVNLEEYHLIQIIDYASKRVTWSYGVAGHAGSAPGYLNTPDDAYKLPNGNVTVADIKNCRILEISPEKQIVRQYGQTGVCKNQTGFLDKPNGDTPLAGGHTLVSNIVGKNLVELNSSWQPVFNMVLPVRYPSDPQLTQAGNILIADYSNPGQVVEVSRQGKVVWQFSGQDGDVKLNHPSLAIELPNGNILANDDQNHRVIVIDKQTKKIIWQYGVTGKPGASYGQLNIPDGLDIIKTGGTLPVSNIGSVSRQAQNFVDKKVAVEGYVLQQDNGYAIFSDEAAGKLGPYDLPVLGAGVTNLPLKQKYILEGVVKYGGLKASNGNPYHLELSVQPSFSP